MTALEPEAVTNAGDHERLDLAVAPLVEKNLEFLNDCLDDIVQEQQKVWGRHTEKTCITGYLGTSRAAARALVNYRLISWQTTKRVTRHF